MKPSVIVTRRWPASVEKALQDKFTVTLNSTDQPFSEQQWLDAFNAHDAVLPTVTDRLDAAILSRIDASTCRTKIIANYGVGFSHIDIGEAQRLGLVVTNTPDVLSECTADIAIMLALMAARRAGEGERQVRSRAWAGWCPTHMIGRKVSGSTFGIIGFGRIGRETARRARGFGMNVIVHNRSRVSDDILQEEHATQVDTLEDLLSQADFVSLHCPGGAENTALINADRLKLMKPTAFLINTARGEVVDEPALLEALSNNQIAGAGLDVFCNEPDIRSEFLELENAVLLPHLGSATQDTREAMGLRVVANLNDFFADLNPRDRVI